MRYIHLLLTFTAGIALVLVILVVLNLDVAKAAPAPTIRYVLGDGSTDTTNCTEPDTPCQTIQYAMAKSCHGDIVRVASKYSPGTYDGTVVISKSITLQGSWRATPGSSPGFVWERITPCDPSRTIIDAGGTGRAISITGNITPTVDCFTITGGDATGLGGGLYGNDAGGGISSHDTAPLIVNNVITANYACTSGCSKDAGVYLSDGAEAWMTNTIVASHTVDIYVDGGCLVVMEGTLWGDGTWANTINWDGNGDLTEGDVIITGNPDFVDPDDGDYHIGPVSAAIDDGMPTLLDFDIDGDPRILGSLPDIGADEAPPTYICH